VNKLRPFFYFQGLGDYNLPTLCWQAGKRQEASETAAAACLPLITQYSAFITYHTYVLGGYTPCSAIQKFSVRYGCMLLWG
jgi:hypothetical protein